MEMACLLLTGMLLMGCSSTPEPQPEPSKKEVQQDADRFFNKMGKQEREQSSSPK
jgi:hypothetical protein